MPNSYGPKDPVKKEGLPIESPTKREKKIRAIDLVIVVADFKSDKENILNLAVGDTIYVITKTESGWWDGVIVNEESSTTSRGWFPSNFTKSSSPHFNDSFQTISPSARPPNLSALLRQNLNEDPSPSSRKNSSVSFASSDRSLRSVSGRKTHSLAETHPSPIVNVKDINLVLPQEIEAMFSSTGSSNVPIWAPVATTENSIVFYNSELNIYCKQLPYISNPPVEENAKIIIPTINQDPTQLSDIDLSEATARQRQQGYRNSVRNRPSTVTDMDSRKGSTKGSTRSRTSISGSGAIHPWNRSLYCEPDLFYYDPTDIKTWTGLRDAFNHFLCLTLDALTKQNGLLFHTYFNIASRLGTLIHLAARLAQHDLQTSNHRTRVQKRLRKIASSIAQIGINGDLYLTESLTERKSTRETIRIDEIPEGDNDDASSPDEEIKFQKSADFLNLVQAEIESLRKAGNSCIKAFAQISSNNLNGQCYLPQIYPRFLAESFSGGNWRNPFVQNPKDPFSGKDVVKSLHHKRVPRVVLNKNTLNDLEQQKKELKGSLSEVLEILKKSPNTQARNVEVLAKVNKLLTISSKYIDIVEGLDFQVFLTNTGPDYDPSKLIYSILSEFFESKQHLRDIFVSIIMECQNITLSDSTVFNSIKQDQLDSANKFAEIEPEKTARFLESELVKLDVENDDISVDPDKLLIQVINNSFDVLEISQTLVGQLVLERDNLLNYAARVMDDFQYEFYNVERDDSLATQEEYALPASTTNRAGTRDEELPWYLESEEYNLIFTQNDCVKGGTREALVQRLTHHNVLDASFNYVFLITFRSMMKTTHLIELLIKRFNIQPSENLSYEEYADWVERKQKPIRLRVVNIMKSLLQRYWIPSYIEPKLSKVWLPFIEMLVKDNFPGSAQLFREFKKNVLDNENRTSETSSTKKEKVYSSKVKQIKITDIEAEEFASQLTLRDSGSYSKIPQMECLDKSWNQKYGPLGGVVHLQQFITNSNDLTNFVSTQILLRNDVKGRVGIIKYYVEVAEKCRKLNNFSSMTAIISALYSSPIHRLKKTWDAVPEPTLSVMTRMNDLMNSNRNFAEYRELLRTISDEPCVPFLGVFLSDLTFTTNGNPDYLHGDHKLVNFSKRIKTVEILREISRYQDLKYNLKKNPDLQDVISYRLSSGMNIDEQYNRSLVIEARVKVSQQIQKKNTK